LCGGEHDHAQEEERYEREAEPLEEKLDHVAAATPGRRLEAGGRTP
jgi:hypothetical protein